MAFLLWSLAFNLMFPLLPVYAGQLGARGVQVGLVAGIAAAGAALLAFPLSALADWRGPRLALLAGWAASAGGWLLMSGASTWHGLLPGAFFITGPIAALPALNALVIDEVPRQRRSRVLSLVYGAAPAGLLLGSALGGALADDFGLAAVVKIAGIGCVTATLSLLWLRRRGRSGRVAVAPAAERPGAAGAAGAAVGSGGHKGAAGPAGAAGAAARAGAEGGTPNRAATATARSPAGGAPGANPGRPVPRAGPMLIGLGIVITAAFTVINMPTNFVVPYLHEVGGQSLRAAGLFTSYLAVAQICWSLLFAVWPRLRGQIRLGPFELQVAPLLGITVALAANCGFGLLMPTGGRWAWYAALFLRGSQYSLQALGSALLGDVVSPGAARTTRMTVVGFGVGAGAVLAPVVAGWLYEADPASPFTVSGVTAAVAAAVLGAGLWYLRRDRTEPASQAGASYSRPA